MGLALPAATTTIRGGGIQPGAVGVETPLVVGCCSAGPTDAARLISSIEGQVAIYKTGPGVKAAAYMFSKVARPFVFVRVPPTAFAATKSAITKAGTGSLVPVATGTPLDAFEIVVVFTAAGAVGTAGISYKTSTNGGVTFAAPIALGTGTTIAIPGTGVSWTLTAAQTVAINDTFSQSTTAASAAILPMTITRAGDALAIPAPSTSAITVTGSPEDAYQVRLEVLTGCTIGTIGGVVRYSLDGGLTFTPPRPLFTANTLSLIDDSATGAILSGLVVNFGAGTIDAGDVIEGRTTAPRAQVSDVLAAMRIARDGVNPWNFVHVVGDCSQADAASIHAETESYRSPGIYVWSLVEARDQGLNEPRAVFTDRLQAAVANYVAPFQSYSAGYFNRITCPITGRQNRRPVAWVAAPRIIQFGIEIDPARKSISGALYSDATLYDVDGNLVEYDANQDVTLHASRYLTARQYPGEAGMFLTRGNTMEAEGGPFNRLPYIRIALLGASVQRLAEQQLLEQGVSVIKPTSQAPQPGQPIPGTIFEGDAINWETEIAGALNRALNGKVTSIKVVVDRTTVLSLTGGKPKVTAFVQPPIFIDFVEGEFVLVDPSQPLQIG